MIDGKLDDPAWNDAPWTDDFVDIEGDAKPKPRFRTRAKMLWDDQNLYIAAELEEPYVWATLREHDSVIFRDPDFEDLVVALNTISTQLQESGYGDRLLAAVFPFEREGKTVYFIYNFKRGAFYPFAPAGGAQQRDNERELRLKAQIGADLPVEAELERWFPLWGAPL